MFNNMMSLKEPMCSIKPELLSIQLHWFVVFYLYIKKCVNEELVKTFHLEFVTAPINTKE